MQAFKLKFLFPLFIFFTLINCFVTALKSQFLKWSIDFKVVLVANCIIFLICILSILMHITAMKNKNPNALIRSVMMSTMLKFIIVAASAFAYAKASGNQTNKYAVYFSMLLYIVYSYLEVKIALKLNKNNGNS